jgi:formylglycine-generating enzyme required for sulfatase activity
MIPVDAVIEDEADLEDGAVNASWILGKMDVAQNDLNFLILDACRDNPFARSFRTSSRGLGRMDAPRGTMIAYSTRPGDVAADGEGLNSPYTLALTTAMLKPNLPASAMFIEARNQVMAATDDQQVPWEEGGLTSQFYFAGLTTSTVQQSTMTPEMLFWQSIQDSQSVADYEAYLRKYSGGDYVDLAENCIASLTPVPEPDADTQVAMGLYYNPGDNFRDCEDCPEMVVIPSGSFLMGSNDGNSDQKPVHRVTIADKFAVGKFEVTRGEYAKFFRATGRDAEAPCYVHDAGWKQDWQNPGHSQNDGQPVACVNWDDARAYVTWLNRETGESYRLLSEAEWEYTARAGSSTKFSFGNSESALCDHGNGADQSTLFDWGNTSCNDGYDNQTAPVGNYRANLFGVHDMHGNVWEWVEDCYEDNYNNVPSNGTANTGPNSCKRVSRGGSWNSKPWVLRSANRSGYSTDYRVNNFGFRIARDF